MKKALLLVWTILTSVGLQAQTPQYFVGSNVNANSIPIGGSVWANNRSQLLYLAGEFGAAPAGTITTIYVRAANSVTATYTNFRVDMGQSNIVTLTKNWEPGLTTVIPTVPSQVLTSVSGQWMAFPLVTPIPYDPTKSLLVDIRQTNTSPAAAITLRYFPSTSGFRRTWTTNPTFNSTSPAPDGLDLTLPASAEYDFGFDILTSCDSPINFKKTTSRFTADVTWDPRPGATTYEYLIDQSPLTPTSSGYSFTNAPLVHLTGLPDGTCYYIHVRTICGTTMMSGWSLDSFCTIADCKVPEVVIDNVQSTTAVATWGPVPGAIGYEYSTGTTPNPPTAGAHTTYTAVKLQGLTPNKPLYFYVRAKCTATPLSEWGVTPFHTAATLGIDDVNSDALTIEAFPNPVKEMMNLKIRGTRGQNAMLVITDVTGRVVHTQAVDRAELDINMSNLAAGTYYLKYNDDNHKELMKLTKQ